MNSWKQNFLKRLLVNPLQKKEKSQTIVNSKLQIKQIELRILESELQRSYQSFGERCYKLAQKKSHLFKDNLSLSHRKKLADLHEKIDSQRKVIEALADTDSSMPPSSFSKKPRKPTQRKTRKPKKSKKK